MRTQRRSARQVVLVRVASTDADGTGDVTSSEDRCTIPGAIFEPEQLLERLGDTQAGVLKLAHWNLPGCHHVSAADRIEVGTGDNLTTWYVNGGGTVWLNRTKVPVTLTAPRR